MVFQANCAVAPTYRISSPSRWDPSPSSRYRYYGRLFPTLRHHTFYAPFLTFLHYNAVHPELLVPRGHSDRGTYIHCTYVLGAGLRCPLCCVSNLRLSVITVLTAMLPFTVHGRNYTRRVLPVNTTATLRYGSFARAARQRPVVPWRYSNWARVDFLLGPTLFCHRPYYGSPPAPAYLFCLTLFV